MSRKDLKCKPLIEAILEVKWKLVPQAAPGIFLDPHYRLLLGRFFERVREKYPHHEALPSSNIPDEMAAFTVQHRFRRNPNEWPLLQLGPGVLTVNDTSGYTWPDFQLQCEEAITKLVDAHPDPKAFQIQEIILRYVDAISFDYTKDNILDFLNEKMKTKIALPETLFNNKQVESQPIAFNWQASYPLNTPKGVITLRFATGHKNKEPALIWETLVITREAHMPVLPTAFPEWLRAAHDVTDDWFFKIIEGDLERKFSGD